MSHPRVSALRRQALPQKALAEPLSQIFNLPFLNAVRNGLLGWPTASQGLAVSLAAPSCLCQVYTIRSENKGECALAAGQGVNIF